MQIKVPMYLEGVAGLDVDASHVFPHGILASTTLKGGMAGNGGVRAPCRVWDSTSKCSVVSYHPVRADPKL